MPRTGDEGQLPLGHQPAELPGGFLVGMVPRAADRQDRTAEPGQAASEVQGHHGAGQAHRIRLAQPAGGKHGPGHQAEHGVLEPEQALGHDELGADQDQGPNPVRMLDPVLQSQDPAQGQTAQGEGGGKGAAVP